MLEIKDYASGSDGNCYLIYNNTTKILLECGVKKEKLITYLMGDGLTIAQLDGCLVSHYHNDHLESINYVKDYIDIYSNMQVKEKYDYVKAIQPKKPTMIGNDIKVIPFNVEHGDCENYGYIIVDKDSMLLFATDCSLIEQNLSNLPFDKICIECNYDDEYLQRCLENPDELNKYKYIRQCSTHMSKKNCFEHLRHMNLSKCKEIVLLHHSKFLISKTKTEVECELTFGIKTRYAKEN